MLAGIRSLSPQLGITAKGSGLNGKTTAKVWSWLLLLVMGVLWGATFSLAKIAADGGGHPLGISYWQSIIGAFFLILVRHLSKQKAPLRKADAVFYLACGLLGSVVPGVIYFYAAARVSPGVLAITVATVPLITFIAAGIIGVEKFRMGRVFGVIIGVLSIFLLVGPDESLPDPGVVPWVLLSLISAFCYSAENLWVALRIPTGVHALTVATGMYIAATLVTTPIILLTGTFVPLAWPWGDSEWAIVGMALLSVVAYSLYIYLIIVAGPVFASQVAYLVTFCGVIWGIIIFDESHSLWIWLSLVTMMAALALVTPRDAKESP
jgi:drug/metabolite transporter (DMT)-like permease